MLTINANALQYSSYHTTRDSIENVDKDIARAFIQMNMVVLIGFVCADQPIPRFKKKNK